MKIAYVHLRDHHDPLWTKGLEEHFIGPGGDVVRPYVEREESQFDRYLDIVPGTVAKVEFEQACTLRQYLARNPERLEVLRRLVSEGQADLLGAGHAMVDHNLVLGESIYRNFLYGFRWMESALGARPRVGDAFDVFGLSAQVPQIMRQFGLLWLSMHSRMFGSGVEGTEAEHVYGQPVRPFWRGLDGSLICVKKDFSDHGIPNRRAFFNYQYRVCPECRGQGCRVCDYAGLDLFVTQDASSLETVLADLASSPHEAVNVHCHTEESIKSPTFVEDLLALGRQYGVEVRFLTQSEIQATWLRPYVEKLKAAAVQEEDIDVRAEGNPIATGCYTVRSTLKRQNRELEHLLLAAETFSALAAAQGLPYATESLADLWRTLNLMQSHDAIGGCHPDEPFGEMQTILRRIRRRAGRRLLEACRWIAAGIQPPARDGAAPVAVFNSLTWPVRHCRVDVIVPAGGFLSAEDAARVTGWTVTTPEGVTQPVLEWKRVTMGAVAVFRIHCLVSRLPACGYQVLFCKPSLADASTVTSVPAASVRSREAEAAGLRAWGQIKAEGQDESGILTEVKGTLLESDRHRLIWNKRGLTEVFDKSMGRSVGGQGTCDLVAEDDIGSPWETLKRFGQRVNLNDVAEMSIRAYVHPCGTVRKLVIEGALPRRLAWDLPGGWTECVRLGQGTVLRELHADEVEVCIDSLRWTHEMWLIDGCDRIPMRTTVECDSQNVRLIMPFVFGFRTAGDRAWYEIPYGMMERPSYQPKAGVHCNPDGTWPAVHWAAAVSPEGYTCAVLNRGVPAHRFYEGVMELSLLRSPRLNVFGRRSLADNRAANPLAKDAGRQVYELAFLSGPGDIADNCLVHRGWEFNTAITAVALRNAEMDHLRRRRNGGQVGQSSSTHSFIQRPTDNVVISSIKQAEDSADLIVRLSEVYGRSAAITLPAVMSADASEASPMEEPVRQVSGRLHFTPFEIKTLRCRSRPQAACPHVAGVQGDACPTQEEDE